MDTIVAIWKSPKGQYFILSSFGRCREIIYDFNKKANIIAGTLEEPFIVTIKDLLPLRTWENDND
ncbi:MAG: hypothetical protein JXR87_09820 [Candidatus Marinimicrobia bacterium]|nr:hypothetical protein [Candidatus Neomarinimicrobiota bacterium]